jgi:hypothetical protein
METAIPLLGRIAVHANIRMGLAVPGRFPVLIFRSVFEIFGGIDRRRALAQLKVQLRRSHVAG